jgi:phosphate-selective porin OprO and OprP
MRTQTLSVLLVLFLATPALPVFAQQANDPGTTTTQAPTREEVEQLRQEVTSQRQTIEQLKQVVQQLAAAKSQDPGGDGARVVNTVLSRPEGLSLTEQAATDKKPADQKSTGITAGWNGEHFYIKSADGNFQLQPYGYVQSDFRAYNGDGAPSATFVIRRARLGFQGNYGKHYDFAFLIDAAASNGITLRDLFLNIKPVPEFQVQVGQMKEPFAQELLEGVTNIDFVERSLASLLYPSAATAFRSPGAEIHGDVDGGVLQYWLGAFNGKGILTNNTTNEPEVIARARIYPFKKHKDSIAQGLAFSAAFGHGRSRGLSNESSFSGVLPDAAFNFFPTFRINGRVQRWNSEFTWVHGPWGVRGEYDELQQYRTGVGSEQSGGIGFTTLPKITGRGGYLQGTYLVTGETRPENGTPKVKHPLLGPEGGRGLGAWEVAFRYDRLVAKEPGLSQLALFTPADVPTFEAPTDAFTSGLNWYVNYWVKYQLNFSVDRLRAPSVGGALPQNYFTVLQRLQFRF